MIIKGALLYEETGGSVVETEVVEVKRTMVCFGFVEGGGGKQKQVQYRYRVVPGWYVVRSTPCVCSPYCSVVLLDVLHVHVLRTTHRCT